MLNPLRPLSLVYLEKQARDYPFTEKILKKLPKAEIIEINSYKEILNPSKQNWPLQKDSQKLVLAVKEDQLIYDGSPYAQNFNQNNFYYNAPILNCLYNCSYCYLQGMFNSPHLVAFVNVKDFKQAALEKLQELQSLYLAISYDTDLLALENIIPYCAEWHSFAKDNTNALIECRTKSVNFKAIENLQAIPNFILAWTISPQIIIDHFEKLTPSLDARIKNIKKAIQNGWKVRLCIDPVIRIENWQNIYTEFTSKIFNEIPATQIEDISLGVFRMNKEYYKKISKFRESEWLYNFPYESNNDLLSYTNKESKEMEDYVIELLGSYNISKDNICVC